MGRARRLHDLEGDLSYEIPGIDGWMRDCEMLWLYETAREMESIVEVGSWKGRSTHALLSGCTGRVVAVDTFLGSPSEMAGAHGEARAGGILAAFTANVGHFANLQICPMSSVQAAGSFPDASVDMVFVDGEHTCDAVTADITAWLPKCKRLLCGHDWPLVSVQQALNASKIPWQKAGEPPNGIWTYRIA